MSCPELLSAAFRHIRDARALIQPGHLQSVDQAWHLIGFGPECCAKACLSDGHFDKALGHSLAHDLVELLIALEIGAARVAEPPPTSLAGWRIDCRYERTGARAVGPVERAVEDVQAAVFRVAARLWVEGRLVDVPS